MEINKPLFIEVSSVDELNFKSKEGYEFITVVYKDFTGTQDRYTSLNGQFMNNPISISGNIPVIEPHKTAYYLMKLNSVAQVIYGSD